MVLGTEAAGILKMEVAGRVTTMETFGCSGQGKFELGTKVNKLPCPSPAKRRHVRPKIDALRREVNGGNVTQCITVRG